ncbi:hypothetical protein [Cytobacillus firmus]|uniref:hypothetical protein n=1 Tax=Cytobacillus firmus TaxID=1399 RepID=UPI001C961D8B|nr:hypothetical protein [Cytobacillus firmus]MBY6052632.1 hypothetical protein [Cytobacillus firmus]
MAKDHPKVLMISHNTFSETLNNGKTYSSIFKNWPKDKLAQLYFQNEIPDFSVCKNYYKITDENILLNKKNNVGEVVTESKKKSIEKTNSPIHSFARKKPLPLFTTLRNFLWESRKWDNENLRNWIEKFSPDLIFFVGGGSSFSYKIVNKLSNRYNIPIFLYYTDDYITPLKKIDPFYWLNYLWLRLELNKLQKNTREVFVIGDDMAEEYKEKLNKECFPIMNAINIDNYIKIPKYNNEKDNIDIRMAYFGGLHSNRWKSLGLITEAIRNLYGDYKISLDIYSNSQPPDEILSKINIPPYSNYKGSINADNIIKKMKEYDILIHVESFDRKMIEKTRLSISTKIPEYLATGIPILGIGPKEVSSIKYLSNFQHSYIIDSIGQGVVEEMLIKISNEKDKHEKMGEQGVKLAIENHSISKNQDLVRERLSRVMR